MTQSNPIVDEPRCGILEARGPKAPARRAPGVRAAYLLSALTLICTSNTASAAMVTFQNSTPIKINDLCADPDRPRCAALPDKYADGALPPPVRANLYPSTIQVPDGAFPVDAKISHVAVTIHGISHKFLNDVDILLVGPQGHYVMLASNVSSAAGGGLIVRDLTWIFDDRANLPLHSQNNNEGRVNGRVGTPGYDVIYRDWIDIWVDHVPRTYRPTDYDLGDYDEPDTDNDRFPSPAPNRLLTPESVVKHPKGLVTSGPTLSFLNGSDPHGVWSLYVVDDYFWYDGRIAGGWSLDITVDESCPTAGPIR